MYEGIIETITVNFKEQLFNSIDKIYYRITQYISNHQMYCSVMQHTADKELQTLTS